MKLHPNKTGLVLGLLLAGVHVIWSLLVLVGWAQAWINFAAWAHMVTPPVMVTGFSLINALTVIIVAFVIGFIVGKVFAMIWNRVQK